MLALHLERLIVLLRPLDVDRVCAGRASDGAGVQHLVQREVELPHVSRQVAQPVEPVQHGVHAARLRPCRVHDIDGHTSGSVAVRVLT